MKYLRWDSNSNAGFLRSCFLPECFFFERSLFSIEDVEGFVGFRFFETCKAFFKTLKKRLMTVLFQLLIVPKIGQCQNEVPLLKILY